MVWSGDTCVIAEKPGFDLRKEELPIRRASTGGLQNR
jgi:hypothetical protein